MARTDYTWFSLYSITRLRRMAEKWRKLAKGAKDTPADVPPGHLAVSVGNPGRRFVIRASYLNHPVFRQLLDQAYEEYGHEHHGPIAFPCNEFIFEQIIQSLGRSKECHRMKQHCCLQATEKERVYWKTAGHSCMGCWGGRRGSSSCIIELDGFHINR